MASQQIDTLWLDCLCVEISSDMCVAVQRGVELEDVEARVVKVQRCHATHEDGGLNGVTHSLLSQSHLLHNFMLVDGRCAVWPGWRAHCCQCIVGVDAARLHA